MDRKYNKGLNIKMTTSVRKDKKRHIPKVEHKWTKNVPPSNNDKISVILINDIIYKPISKFTEKVKDTFFLRYFFCQKIKLENFSFLNISYKVALLKGIIFRYCLYFWFC